jgi:hypothetical protein
VEELLGCDNAHAIDELLARQYSTDPQAFAWGFRLPEAIASTTAQRPAWGRAIMSDLLATGSWDSQYWAWVLSGLALSGAQIGDDMLLPVCGLLADVIGHIPEHSALASTLRPISQFLMSAVNRPSMPIESLGALERLGALVAATASLGPLDSVTEEPEGVLDRASNDWTGWFTRFWIDATSLRWKIEEETWSALPAGTRTALEAVLNAPGPTSVYPQSILAAKYDFWAAADEQWTREHIRPLFSWEHDAVRAVRAWSSFVDGASLNERVLRHLREDFHGAFRAFRGRLGAKFAKRFAEVMVRSNSDYVSDGTLADFVAMSDEDMRGVFARQVGWWLLHQTTESYSESQWSRWIENYLITRIAAVPLPLSPSEAASMISWVVASGKYFPRAVSLYTESDPQFAQTFDVWRDISKFHLADTYPSDLAHLLNFILARTERSSFYSCDDIGKLLAKLMEHLTSDARPVLLSICESAARLSCGHASAWRSAVDTRWPS